MIVAATVYDVIAAVGSTLAVAIIALSIALARTREKLVKLEEWIRLREEQNGKKS